MEEQEKLILDEHHHLEETLKKSNLQAKGRYDFHKLETAGDCFLSLDWEEQDESIVFRYDVQNLTPFNDIRNEEYTTILNLLMQVSRFEEAKASYVFSMKPGNLYYHTSGRVLIKSRDLKIDKTTKEDFLLCYKALVACVLTGQYSYKDYLEGGEDLLQKHAITSKLYAFTEVAEILAYLEALKQSYIQKQKATMVYVKKWRNWVWKIATCLLLVTTILFGFYGARQHFQTIPYLSAVNQASNAWVENDIIGIIDALAGIEVENLELHQMYILASAYAQSENLAHSQRANILGRLNLHTNPWELEYWIRIGRLEVDEAIDLAMRLSNDELLLYAYLVQNAQIEANTSLSGAEREQQLREVQGRIDGLSTIFDTNEDETEESVEVEEPVWNSETDSQTDDEEGAMEDE